MSEKKLLDDLKLSMMPEILAQSKVVRHWERTIILTIFAIIKDRRGKGWLKTKKMSYKLLIGKSGCDRTQIWEVRKRLIRAGIFSIKDLPGELADEWTYLGIPEGWDKNWSDEVRKPKKDVVPVEHDVALNNINVALNNIDVAPVTPISEDSIRGLSEDLKTEDSIYRISTLNIKRCSRHSIRGAEELQESGNLSINKRTEGFNKNHTNTTLFHYPEHETSPSTQEPDAFIDETNFYGFPSLESEEYDDLPEPHEFNDPATPKDYKPVVATYQAIHFKIFGVTDERRLTNYIKTLALNSQAPVIPLLSNPLFMEGMFEFCRTPFDMPHHSYELANKINLGLVADPTIINRFLSMIPVANGRGNNQQKKWWRQIEGTRLAEILRQIKPFEKLPDLEYRFDMETLPFSGSNRAHDKVEKPTPDWMPAKWNWGKK